MSADTGTVGTGKDQGTRPGAAVTRFGKRVGEDFARVGAATGEGGAGGGTGGAGGAGRVLREESGNWRIRFVRLQAESGVEVEREVGGLVGTRRRHLA